MEFSVNGLQYLVLLGVQYQFCSTDKNEIGDRAFSVAGPVVWNS